jgi:hypothetical protein
MRGTWRALSVLVLACGLLAAAAATGAAAATTAQPSLAGEQLIAGNDIGPLSGTSMYEVTLRCGATTPSWWTYAASGVATGPYPGTFTETGTVYVNATGLGESGPLVSVHADFTISSGTTVITGTKDMTLLPTDTGSCLSAADHYDAKFTSAMSYTATVDTGSGSFTDSGSATVETDRAEAFQLGPDGAVSLGGPSHFRASFDSSNGVTPTPTQGGSVVGVGLAGGWTHPVVFGFFGKQTSSGLRGLCGVLDPLRRTLVVCTSVTSFTVSGTHATLTGDAYVNAVKTHYRIDVTDGGSSPYQDSFAIQTDSGYSAQGSLQLGAVRIH